MLLPKPLHQFDKSPAHDTIEIGNGTFLDDLDERLALPNALFLSCAVPAKNSFRVDLAPKFYPVLSLLQRFWVAVFGAVAAGCGAEPFQPRSTASRRGLIV